MKTAIALFGDEVSPRFGCAREFLVVTHEDGRCVERDTADVHTVAPGRLAFLLASLGVEEVVCGGIHRRFLRDLRDQGIQVTWGVIGPAEEALDARLTNRLQTNQVMAGPRCRQRRERRRLCSQPPPLDRSSESESSETENSETESSETKRSSP